MEKYIFFYENWSFWKSYQNEDFCSQTEIQRIVVDEQKGGFQMRSTVNEETDILKETVLFIFLVLQMDGAKKQTVLLALFRHTY